VKHLSWLLGNTFYLITSSWLNGPRWLGVWLYQSYLNPALMVSLVGFVCHPSLIWLSGLVIAATLTTSVITRADAQCSIKHLTEAYNDILDGENFLLKPLAADSFLSSVIKESSSLAIYKHLQNTLVKDNLFYHTLFKNPLRVFVTECKENGKILSSPKAYTNFLGQSLVFLHRPVEQMDTIDRFVVLHELEHINLDGARQLSRIHSRPFFMFFSTILLCFIVSDWWNWLLIIVYVLLNLNTHLQAKTKREVIADNAALIKLSSFEEQKEVVEYLIELSIENLENTTNLDTESINKLTWEEIPFKINIEEQKQRIKLINELKKQDKMTYSTNEWIDRLRHFLWYEYRLNKGESLPVLGWTSYWDNIAPVPFAIFFVYLGVITSSLPLFPFILMLTFIVIDMFLFLIYMKEFHNISSSIDNCLVEPNL
jgi:hypothetical protein